MVQVRHADTLAAGLSHTEAQQRLAVYGPNEISHSSLTSRLEEIAKVLWDPMGVMLLGLAGLYAALGSTTDALILLIAWVPVTAVDVLLELRANRALKALRQTLSTTAKVMRDGAVRNVATREIVPGDLLVFEEGQNLPADGRVIEAQHLAINEAALTGESLPVEKSLEHQFFGGTQVLGGRGLGIVEKTGAATRFGQVASLLRTVQTPSSPLKRKVDRLVKQVVMVAIALAGVLFVLEWFRSGDLITSVIIALTFGMSAVPEEFPLVFTLYLSLGAWRLAQKRVLVKSLPSVEALGSADVLCTDKTGTLTTGRFELEQIRAIGGFPENLLWTAALMACEPHAVDAIEAAILERGREHVGGLAGWKLTWDYPFENVGKHMTHVWCRSGREDCRIVMKGAIEGVLAHCDINDSERADIHHLVGEFAAQGKRLLGLAWREGPAVGTREADERSLTLAGLLIFSDPIRDSAVAAIAECQAFGIAVKMVTGDHPLTAHAIAERAGIAHSDDALYTGDDLRRMDAASRTEAYIRGAVFSRVVPEQKYELVKALRESGRIVAMVGDGINDAPALRLADIGISMGHTATDVARSAGQIVILDSDLSGIVATLVEGRTILSNLKKSFNYLVAFHTPVILLALIPPFLSWAPLLLPVHIIVLEFLVHPISAFTFENLSVTKERGSAAPNVFGRETIVRPLFSGLIVSIGILALYAAVSRGHSVDAARTAAFAAILVANMGFVVSEVWPQISGRFAVTVLTLFALCGLIASIPLPALHFTPIPANVLGFAVLMGIPGFVAPFLWKATGGRVSVPSVL
jgi:Ca2+-transporting ATPase